MAGRNRQMRGYTLLKIILITITITIIITNDNNNSTRGRNDPGAGSSMRYDWDKTTHLVSPNSGSDRAGQRSREESSQAGIQIFS